MPMRRIKLTVAYDGTNYHGWQVQPNGITVEEVLNRQLSELLQEDIQVIGASRTDAGVHALGNVAVFDTEARIPGDKISFALNQRLPEDIRVQQSEEVAADFHPRYQSSRKTYQYKVLNRTFQIPQHRFDAHFVYVPLDLEKMQQAARYLEGEHDFKSFCSVNAQVLSTVRTIYSIQFEKQADMITMTIEGNGFLYNMVRIIMGTLLEVGRGVLVPEQVEDMLLACDREAAGPTAPAKGLTLVKIEYEKDSVTS